MEHALLVKKQGKEGGRERETERIAMRGQADLGGEPSR
jgi:hypothetical protein